ncbi:hypothetical protein NEDG_00440 [Nematocida displodere]|uniref:Mechanosensitive ion channel MscS domain-containing protein n=1 Tax=Nematocida displodere TaxID=1805483 RepID=A0A177EJ28_9MICR|nr:hypothetical protein NEDG_00440 [Nematocida displodere]
MKRILERLSLRVPSALTAVATASVLSYTANSSVLSSYRPVLNDLAKSASFMMYAPFSVGDSVTIASCSGRVADISLRYVVLESKEFVTYIPTFTIYNTIVKKHRQTQHT